MKAIIGKRYRHYRGGEYTVVATGRMEADPNIQCVVYRAEYETEFGVGAVWIRPIDGFESMVESEGKTIVRFTQIDG